MRVRKPPDPTNQNVEGREFRHSAKNGNEFIEPRLGPFADEFGGDVKVVRRAPLDMRMGPQMIYQLSERALNILRDGDAGEQTHGPLTSDYLHTGCGGNMASVEDGM